MVRLHYRLIVLMIFLMSASAVSAQTETLVTDGGLSVTYPNDFTVIMSDGLSMMLNRESDLLIVRIYAGDDATLYWRSEALVTSAEEGMRLYTSAGMLDTAEQETVTLDHVTAIIQPHYEAAYGENLLFIAAELPDGTVAAIFAYKLDGEVNEDRETVLSIVDSLNMITLETQSSPAPEVTPIALEEMPPNTILFPDGSQFEYSEDWEVSPYSSLVSEVMLALPTALDPSQARMTMYFNDNYRGYSVRNAQEIYIEPTLQHSGLADFEAEDDFEVVFEEGDRQILFFMTDVWSEFGFIDQVNVFYLVSEGETFMALFQTVIYDIENVDAIQEQVLDMAMSFQYGGDTE